MTLSELGSLGELVGGVAIIISLIYVGIQIRQSTSASQVATTQAFSKQFNDVNRMFADAQMRKLFAEGMSGLDRLDAADQVGFMTIMSSISRTLESFYYQQLRGGLDSELFDGWFLQYLDLLANTGPSEFWGVKKASIYKGVRGISRWPNLAARSEFSLCQ